MKYTGSTANPAIVTQQVLAQVLGFEQVKVLESTYNVAKPGEEADMQFICDSNAALMCYATNTPQVDEPSAGYIFTWDMLGNGSYTAMDQYEGENGTHSEFIEGLMSTDMRKTADDLATYFPSKVFWHMNQVRAKGTPKYFKNAPSMNERGGRFPKSITANTDTTNHAICVNVMGNGSLKSLME